MGAPSFKECIAADVPNVFLNRLEFADTHTGLYKSRRLIYVARSDFGPRPAIGAVLTLDRQQYRIVDCKEEAGIFSIELGVPKS